MLWVMSQISLRDIQTKQETMARLKGYGVGDKTHTSGVLCDPEADQDAGFTAVSMQHSQSQENGAHAGVMLTNTTTVGDLKETVDDLGQIISRLQTQIQALPTPQPRSNNSIVE